jgi:hypothetical protein
MSFHISVNNLDSIEKRVVRKLDYIRVIPFAFMIVLIYGNGAAVSVGSIFGYGVGHKNGVGRLQSWKW